MLNSNKGNWYIFKGDNPVEITLIPFWNRVHSSEMGIDLDSLPLGAYSFLIEKAPFQKELVCRNAKRKSQKLFPIHKMAKKRIQMCPVSLKPNVCKTQFDNQLI